MKKVKLKRADLLDQVIRNKERHVAEYNEAREGFIENAVKEMKKMLRDAKKGEVRLMINLTPPQSHEHDYDRVIGMLSWSQDEFVELDAEEFEQYVRDNWNWKRSFTMTTALYNKKVM